MATPTTITVREEGEQDEEEESLTLRQLTPTPIESSRFDLSTGGEERISYVGKTRVFVGAGKRAHADVHKEGGT